MGDKCELQIFVTCRRDLPLQIDKFVLKSRNILIFFCSSNAGLKMKDCSQKRDFF